MKFSRPFDEFDPLSDEAPKHPFSLLPDILDRARLLLTRRSRDQIVSAAFSIGWFIDEYFRGEKDRYVRDTCEHGSWILAYLPEDDRTEQGVRWLLDNWPAEADDVPPSIPDEDNTTDVAALQECIGGYVLEDDSEFPNGLEHEYFAVLALLKIADVQKWLGYQKAERSNALAELIGHSLPERPIADLGVRYSLAGECAIEAMDALGWAEHLKMTAALREERDKLAIENLRKSHPAYFHEKALAIAEELVKDRISVAASKAAIRRHAENHAMKAQVWEWYAVHKDEYGSMEKAAEAVTGTVKLVPVSFRTAADWIRDWVKQQRLARTV